MELQNKTILFPGDSITMNPRSSGPEAARVSLYRSRDRQRLPVPVEISYFAARSAVRRRCGCGARPEVFRVDVPAGAADVRHGVLASGDSVVSARGARLMLADITGADIVDMEGAGIAAAAASGRSSCFMVKCVSDGIDTDEAMLTADFRRTARRAFDAFDMILKKSQV